ncbi:hypothetical protein RUM44_003659 [Polyplax serrata]|uniref:Uncharacterized protein n=1 Tax=Polyplax serrata TaxID=468196 RepID=A0ABR1AH36_POLSC
MCHNIKFISSHQEPVRGIKPMECLENDSFRKQIFGRCRSDHPKIRSLRPPAAAKTFMCALPHPPWDDKHLLSGDIRYSVSIHFVRSDLTAIPDKTKGSSFARIPRQVDERSGGYEDPEIDRKP